MTKLSKKEVVSSMSDKKTTELITDLKRVHADFINYKRRTEADQAQILDLAKQTVISRFLPLVDNIERALGHLPKDLANHPWAKGVAQVAKQAETLLNELGAERIQALGAEFDPKYHEAMSLDDGPGDKEVVSAEIQPGWKIGSQIIRPALVKVGKPAVKSQKREGR